LIPFPAIEKVFRHANLRPVVCARMSTRGPTPMLLAS
jgi:hypothetical protein